MKKPYQIESQRAMKQLAKMTAVGNPAVQRAPPLAEMIDWLCNAFGFEKQVVFATPDGKVMHSQLIFGNGMMMVGSVDNGSPSSKLMRQPDEIGGAETQAPYLVVDDIDAMYASAKAAGAEIVFDLEEKDYGGKAFSCRDPEGHIWHVGTFDPWEPPPAQ